MTHAVSDVPLTERADEALANGQAADALRIYAALLEADPLHSYAWYRTAALLEQPGSAPVAAAALARVVHGLAERGELLLAVCALKDLERLDAPAGAAQRTALAALYGREGARVERERRSAPPPVRNRAADTVPPITADGESLRQRAGEACERAAHSAAAAAAGTLPFHPLLSDLGAADLEQLISLMRVRSLAPNEAVIEQGSEGEAFFIVVRGVMEVRRDDVHLAYLRSGAFFGEMALLTRSPRMASVTSRGAGTLIELDRHAVEELASRNPAVGQVLARYTRDRMLRNLMATSPVFAPLDAVRRDALMALFTSRVHAPGEVVLAEGDEAEGLHVVLSGEVRVSKLEDGEPLALADLGPGQVFGEMSLIQQTPATATITALRKSVVLRLPRDAFNARVTEFPEVLAHLFALARERREANTALATGQLVAVEEDLLI